MSFFTITTYSWETRLCVFSFYVLVLIEMCSKKFFFNSKKHVQKLFESATKSSNVRSKPAKDVTVTFINSQTMGIKLEPKKKNILKELFQSRKGAYFDKRKSEWRFPMEQFSGLYSEIRKYCKANSLKLNGPPKNAVELTSKHNIHDYNNSLLEKKMKEKLPECLLKQLASFQKTCVKVGINANGRIIIGDEMGLGKTLEALSIAKYYENEWPLLIICPSSLRFTWREEIKKWLCMDQNDIQIVNSGKDRISTEHKVVVVSYGLIPRLSSSSFARFKVVIGDECHYIKSDTSLRTNAVLPLLKQAKHAILLSGTPTVSKPIEMFTLIQAVAKGNVMGDKVTFGKRYCNAVMGNFGWDFRGHSNLSEFNAILSRLFLIRRLKQDVLKELPGKVREVVSLQTPSMFRKNFKMVRDSGLDLGNRFDKRVTQLYQEAGEAKLDGVLEYIETLLEGDQKFLIFAHHTSMLSAISVLLQKKKVHHININGQVLMNKRKALCDEFQENENCRAAVLGIRAAGVGITLTKATVVVFAELWWNSGDLVQAEDRAHRIGQRDCVNVKYLIGMGTYDGCLWEKLRKKAEVVSHTLDGESKSLMSESQPKSTSD